MPHTWASTGAARWIVLCVVALLIASFAPLTASAQDSCSGAAAGCDEGQAYAACMVRATSDVASLPARRQNPTCKKSNVSGNPTPTAYWACFDTRASADLPWQTLAACTGRYDFVAGKTCATRLDGDVGMINGTLYSGGVCDKGCKVKPNLAPDVDFSLRETGNPNAISIRGGTWRATGEVCSSETDQKPDKKDEFCHTTSSGHTVCKGKDKTCVTTASGFRTCASDTANKKGHTSTDTSRSEAASIGAPDTPPNPPTNRPGENWQQSGNTTNITNNHTGSTTNNATYNNVGKPNGNQPVPGDGSGPGQGGSNGGLEGEGGSGGDGEPDYGSVGGDGQCTGSFTCTGGDPVLCSIAQQTYQARCEAEGRWGEGEGVGQFPGDGDGGAGEDPDPKSAVKSAMPRLAMLDESGFFGGGSCPQFPAVNTRWGAFEFNNADFCKLIGVARGALILLGAFIALGILMGWQGRD